MVEGLRRFAEHFAAFTNQYVLIGGTVCSVLMEDAGGSFRSTKDLDVVLCLDALSSEFVTAFWQFIADGKYQLQEKGDGSKYFYRFARPGQPDYPYMIELFARAPGGFALVEGSHLTPVPTDAAISSLSAILLDDGYYGLIQQGRTVLAGVSVATAECLIPLKSRAWLDMDQRQQDGLHVDAKEINKHRKDVLRLLAIAGPEKAAELVSSVIRSDLARFAQAMRKAPLEPKALGFPQLTQETLIAELERIYELG